MSVACQALDVTDARLQPRIGWRNHWWIVNGYGGVIRGFTGTRKQAEKALGAARGQLQVRQQLHVTAIATANADFEVMRNAQTRRGLRLTERGVWIRGLPASGRKVGT